MSQDLLPALQPLVSRVRTDVTAAKTERGMIWTREALTEVRLRRHLSSEQPRGCCPIKAGESTTQVALLDLDSHKDETPWEEMKVVAARVCEALSAAGFAPVPWASSGGRGIHIYMVWAEPQDAYSVRMALREVLVALGYSDGAKGVARGQIEVFPKQDAVPADGYGNQFILPLSGKSAPLEPMLAYEVMPREYALALDWPVSDPVPARERPVVERPALPAVQGGALDELRSALAAIDNDGEGLGYDEWRDIVAGIHHASSGSEEGYALALEFSQRSAKFEDEAELRDKVWGWLDSRPPSVAPITAATVLAKAREAGWTGVTLDDFRDLTVTEEGEPVEETELPLPAFKRDGNGKIEAVVNNLALAIDRPDITGYDVRWDEFREEMVWAPHAEPGAWRAFKDRDYTEIRKRLEAGGFKPIAKELLGDVIHHRATGAPIDTAMMWLDGLVWDGVPRIETFLTRACGVEDEPYHRAVSLYAWTAHAARVLKPGCQADMVPVLISPEQGLRKSSLVAALVPEGMARLLSFNQKEEERARLLRGCLVAEIAELDGLRTREIEEIRAWVTRRVEEWTPKYKEFAVRMPRRLLLWGTSNRVELFDDPNEERRFLPVVVRRADVEWVEAARDQLWAEARVRFEAEGVLWQEAERLGRERYQQHRIVDTWEEALIEWANRPALDGAKPAEAGFTVREAMSEALGLTDRTVKRADEMRAAKALKSAGFEKRDEWREGKTCKIWRVRADPLA